MLQEWFQHPEQIFSLSGQKLAVLVADLFGRPFEVYIDPSVALETVTTFETVIFRDAGFPLPKPELAA